MKISLEEYYEVVMNKKIDTSKMKDEDKIKLKTTLDSIVILEEKYKSKLSRFIESVILEGRKVDVTDNYIHVDENNGFITLPNGQAIKISMQKNNNNDNSKSLLKALATSLC